MKKNSTLLVVVLATFTSIHPLYAGTWKTLDELKSMAGVNDTESPDRIRLKNFTNYRFKKIRLTCDNLNASSVGGSVQIINP